mmetsp:Transcript_34488/g.78715  ORF Transcript_34488/g.78715 Transcript_34488/m.78715 type:complete len:220 (-) Transcript_34488:7-666(-)
MAAKTIICLQKYKDWATSVRNALTASKVTGSLRRFRGKHLQRSARKCDSSNSSSEGLLGGPSPWAPSPLCPAAGACPSFTWPYIKDATFCKMCWMSLSSSSFGCNAVLLPASCTLKRSVFFTVPMKDLLFRAFVALKLGGTEDVPEAGAEVDDVAGRQPASWFSKGVRLDGSETQRAINGVGRNDAAPPPSRASSDFVSSGSARRMTNTDLSSTHSGAS